MPLIKPFLAIGLWLGLSLSALAAEETVVLSDGEAIKLYYFAPDSQVEAPRLAILVPGSFDDEYMAKAQYWIGREMVNRGWAIAVPISPKGRKYFVNETRVFPELVGFIHDTHELHNSKPLLLGISQGGSAALAIAAKRPELYAGVVAAPGRIWDKGDFKDLDGLPVYLRVGEKDTYRWHKKVPEMVNVLHGAGANVDAALVPDAKHLFQLDWQDFDSWLNKLKQADLK